MGNEIVRQVNKRVIAIAIVALIALSGCAARNPALTARQQFYRDTLAFVQRTDEIKTAIMQVSGKALAGGLIDAGQGERLRALGQRTDIVLSGVLTALEVYIKITDTRADAGQEKVMVALAEATRVVAELANLAAEWGVRK